VVGRNAPPTCILSEGGGVSMNKALHCSKRKMEGGYGLNKPFDSHFEQERVMVSSKGGAVVKVAENRGEED